MLTQEEKWYLDLLGYFVVRDAVPKADVEMMKAQMFEWYRVGCFRFQTADAS